METESPGQVESRRVAVLFADITGFSALNERLGTEAAYLIVTGCLRLLDAIARRHGGSVDKYLGDRLMVVFGHPLPVANPSRAAAHAALEMRERVRRYNREAALSVPLDLRVGINTGEVVAGRGGPVVREFHVLGDAVNIAARLNAKAGPGRVFVGAETHGDSRDEFGYRALEPLRLKGKREPVPAFELRSARGVARSVPKAADTESTPLVGRSAEWERIQHRADALASGRGGSLVIEGTEGIGKSRMLGELAACPSLRSAKVLAVSAETPDVSGAAPLRSLVPLIAAWAGIRSDAAANEQRRLLAAALGRELSSERARRLQRLFERALGVQRRWAREARAPDRGLLEALARALAGTSDAPVAILLDDAHALDPASRAVVESLFRRAGEAPLLVGLSTRVGSEPLDPGVEALAARADERIRLPALDAVASRALVEALVSGEPLRDEVRDLIEDRGGGNPGRLVAAVGLAPALESELAHDGRLQARRAGAERRRAAVLFADISGFTALTESAGAERTYPVVAACLDRLDAVARRHGGTVDHHLGDCVLALFGVPEAIEDAPRAAVNAAIEMRASVAELATERDISLSVHSGIATGMGIAGDISGPLIRDFAVMGEHVDLAYALTDLASAGEICVGAETQQQTRDVFEYRELPAMRAVPESEPAPVFQVLSQAEQLYRPRLDAGRASHFVGRADALEAIATRLRDCAAGRGGVLSVIGDAGLGKTRLVLEASRTAGDHDLLWLEGRCLAIGSNLGFHPFQDLLRAWTGIDERAQDETAAVKLASACEELLGKDGANEVRPFVAALLGLPLSEHDEQRLRGLEGEALERLRLAAIARVLRALAASRPCAIVLEDLHWSDRSSLDLLANLLRVVGDAPLLFVLVFRPGYDETSEPARAAAREQLGERYAEVLLEPLDASASEQLIDELLAGARVPARVRDEIERRTAGNPFFIEALMRSLVEQGALEVSGDALLATERIHEAVIPGTVQEVIMARIDRLAPALRTTLQAASVIGRDFRHSVIAGILENEEVDRDLEELVGLGFLGGRGSGDAREYVFPHPLLRDVCYDAILGATRRDLHLRTAHSLESRVPPGSPGYYGMLAFHFGQGRDLELAEQYLFRAGDEASRVAASSEALHFFQEAWRLYQELHGGEGDPAKSARLQGHLAHAYFNRGQFHEAVEHFNRTLRFHGAPVPARASALVVRTLSTVARTFPPLYAPVLERRGRTATAKQREVLDLMFKRSRAETTTEPLRFVADTLEILRQLTAIDPTSVSGVGGFYSGFSGLFSYAGLLGPSARFLERAHVFSDHDDPPEAFLYRVFRFLHQMLAGEWSEKDEIEEPLVQEIERLGVLWDLCTYLGLLAKRRAYQGDFSGSAEAVERLRKIEDLYAYDLARESHLGCATFLAAERGDLVIARHAAEAYWKSSQEVLPNILALGTAARVHALLGELSEAREVLERGEALAREAGRAPPFHQSCLLRSRLLLELSELEAAVGAGERERARRARRAARRTAARALRSVASVAWRRPEVQKLAGRLAWLDGHERRAGKLWREALNEAEAIGTRPEQARIHAEIANRLRASGRGEVELAGLAESEHRARAVAILEELGLVDEAGRVSADERAP